jgi:3-isopropylmalate/(R)-2-methylmalate dehydratase small subunit
VCPEANRIPEGSYVGIDTKNAVLRLYDEEDPEGDSLHAPEILQCQRIPSFLVEMAAAGGLLAQLQQKLSTT